MGTLILSPKDDEGVLVDCAMIPLNPRPVLTWDDCEAIDLLDVHQHEERIQFEVGAFLERLRRVCQQLQSRSKGMPRKLSQRRVIPQPDAEEPAVSTLWFGLARPRATAETLLVSNGNTLHPGHLPLHHAGLVLASDRGLVSRSLLIPAVKSLGVPYTTIENPAALK